MSQKLLTFDKLVQNLQALIGDGAGDLWNKDGLTATMPHMLFTSFYSAQDSEATMRKWGINVRCLCLCPCGYIEDVDLGTISYTYADNVIPVSVSESYVRVSLFDFFDLTDDFGPTDNEYCSWIEHRYNSVTGFCVSTPYAIFSQVSNAAGAGGVGVGAGILSLDQFTRIRTALTCDWDSFGYPQYLISMGALSDFNNPDPFYPQGATFAGSWDYDDGRVTQTFSFAKIETSGVRPITTSDQILPDFPVGV